MVHVQELFDLTGKVAIVTGGGSGLGRQMADALAECGADLVLCARKVERCEEAAAELAQAIGVRARRRSPATSASPAQSRRSSTGRVAELGGVDILVNNAGTSWGASPEETPLDGWQKVIDVNVTGAFLFAQAAGRVMIEQGDGGKIVNIASVAAFRGAPPEAMNAIAYNTSKGAARRVDPRPRGQVGAVRDQRQRDRARLVPLGHVGGGARACGRRPAHADPARRATAAPTTSRARSSSSPRPPPTTSPGVTLPVDGGQLAG